MGGDDGHHHKLKVPDYRSYKVEDCPKLLNVQKALAQKGLKDPWLRFVKYHFWFSAILYTFEIGYDFTHMFGVHLLCRLYIF
jgi:hypothetical protein